MRCCEKLSHALKHDVSAIHFPFPVQHVMSQAEIRVIWVSSWYDPGKESDTAQTLIDQGVDIIL